MFILNLYVYFFFQLQTPQSFVQSVNEFMIALQRCGDPSNLSRLRLHYELLANIDPSPGMCQVGGEQGRVGVQGGIEGGSRGAGEIKGGRDCL